MAQLQVYLFDSGLTVFSGRTHQLRVHSAHIGHKIVGDYTYSNREDCDTRRMMLHAHRLMVNMEEECLNIEAPDPFVTETDSSWIVEEEICSYSDAVAICEQFKETRDCSGICVKR